MKRRNKNNDIYLNSFHVMKLNRCFGRVVKALHSSCSGAILVGSNPTDTTFFLLKLNGKYLRQGCYRGAGGGTRVREGAVIISGGRGRCL